MWNVNPCLVFECSNKVHKKHSIKSVVSISKAIKLRVRAKPMTTRTLGIDTSHLARFTAMPVSRTQHYIWTKLGKVRMAK